MQIDHLDMQPRRSTWARSSTKYWAIFRMQVLHTLAYGGDLVARGLSIAIFLWVFIQLWQATFRSSGESMLAGFTLNQTLWYLMLAEAILLSTPNVAKTVADAVRDGTIAYLLNKPYNFWLYQISVTFGDTLVLMGLNTTIGGAIVWVAAGPPPSPATWPLVVIVVIMAWLISFCVSAIIGLMAFLTEDVNGFVWIYTKLQFILGGLLIPLDFFPDWLRSIALVLPFAHTLYGPARLFVAPSMERFWTLLLIQGIWVVVLGTCLGLLYRRLARWLTINGG